MAVSASLQAYLNDPQAASDSVFGRPLNADGAIIEQPAPRVGPADRSYNRSANQATIASETTGEISLAGQPNRVQNGGPAIAPRSAAGQTGVGQQPQGQTA